MDLEFVKGAILSSSFLICYKVYSDLYYENIIYQNKLDELEKRIDNLEDFRLRFYQLYSVRSKRIWDEEDLSDDEDYDEYDEDDDLD